MLGYACLYYIFAALVLDWVAGLGWDKPTLALGPTLAIVIAAGLAPVLGRFVDKGFGPEILLAGPRLGAGALVRLSQITAETGYLLAWAGPGLTALLGLSLLLSLMAVLTVSALPVHD